MNAARTVSRRLALAAVLLWTVGWLLTCTRDFAYAQRTPAPEALPRCVVRYALEGRTALFLEIERPQGARCVLDLRATKIVRRASL